MQENEWNTQEDWDLAECAKDGSEDAYAALIARHQNPIHSFIFRSVGNEETAKDLTQEVFIKAYFALPRVIKKAKFTTWLFQIAVNLCRDHAKSKAVRQARLTHSFTQNPDERDVPQQIEFPHPGATPDRQSELSELMRLLDDEISHLPVDLRYPFLLATVEGHSHKEVAAILGISAKAVEIRIYRARHFLTERFAIQGILSL